MNADTHQVDAHVRRLVEIACALVFGPPPAKPAPKPKPEPETKQ